MHSLNVFKDSAGQWRWHRKAANGEIISDSAEGYVRRVDAVHGMRLANPDWNDPEKVRQSGAGGIIVRSERRDPINDEIVIGRDGLTIGGRRFPGLIAKDGLKVVPSDDGKVWLVDLTLVTATPPRFVGTRISESGEVIVDDEQEPQP